MLFRRFKTPGLAHHAYLLECGEAKAVVVDPRRDVAEYVEAARGASLQIAYVLQTHRQEDFEHGAAALAAATGAKIVTGAHELFGRSDRRLADGEALAVGGTRFVALHTPGHTPESVCYAVYRKDAGERCWALFSGDALFVSETGRTDLADPQRTAENAGLLYDALHARVAPLGDQALLFPAHGAGSACGGKIADRDESTLGIEKQTNAVFTKSRAEFVAHKLAERLPRPPYFAHMERVNLEGGRPIAWPPRIPVVLPPESFQSASREGIVLDTRAPDAFAAAHVPGSYNVWLGGLSTFAGWLAEPGEKLFLALGAPGELEPAVLALARVGLDDIAGVLAGGVSAWREAGLPLAMFGTLGAAQARAWMEERAIDVLDVRDDAEWSAGHIPGAAHTYVGHLEARLPARDGSRPLVVHCSVGNRSGLAASILARHGHRNIYNMLVGMKAWRNLEFPTQS